jgi:hypothetical protein
MSTAAQNASPEASAAAAAGTAANADCSLVTAGDAAAILGYDVLPASESARTGGVCFYASQTISQDGGVSYALTDAARLRAIRPYFIALARKCAGIAPSAPNAAACATYAKVARSADLDAYFAARTETTDATAVPGLGERAVSAAGTLYVRRGATIYEALVRRDGAFDIERSEQLVRLLLARMGPEHPSGV